MTEFWNELLTKASWEKLQEMAKEMDFVLIGGWSAYLWTGQHKSKDIDIIVDYETLAKLQQQYRLEKNERLRKYEIKLDKFDIDIYLPFFSKLALPLDEIAKNQTTKIQNIKTVKAEILLILKQGAEIDRRNSVKGIKDSIDIVTLLIHAPIDWTVYSKVLKENKMENYKKELLRVLTEFDDENIRYVGMDFQQFKNWKRKKVDELKKL